jgi:hypothetical protein
MWRLRATVKGRAVSTVVEDVGNMPATVVEHLM